MLDLEKSFEFGLVASINTLKVWKGVRLHHCDLPAERQAYF